jgi:acetyl-CoA carboxylase biotin carboxylase subunit
MEMNTRIQVGHPITEQGNWLWFNTWANFSCCRVAISGKNYLPELHAIECRINAEDPYNDFRPSPGK